MLKFSLSLVLINCNKKSVWIPCVKHLGDDKMTLRDLDKNTPDSIRLSSCKTWQEAMDLLEKEFMNKPKLKKMFLSSIEAFKPTGRTPQAILRSLLQKVQDWERDLERLHISEDYLTKNMSVLAQLESLIPKEFRNSRSMYIVGRVPSEAKESFRVFRYNMLLCTTW